MRILIEMEVGDADLSEVLEMAQELAVEISNNLAEDDGDELSEDELEVVRADVSVTPVRS